MAKGILKNAKDDGRDYIYSLLEYRNPTVSDQGASPSQILISRILRSKVPMKESLLEAKIVDVRVGLLRNRERSRFYYDRNARCRSESGV